MEMETVKYRLTGRQPGTLMNNGRMSNPLNSFARQLAELTAAKKKTEQQHLEIMRLEWEGGLYLTSSGAPCWPAIALKSLLVAGAKFAALGKKFRAGVFVDAPAEIEYDGPRDVDGLWAAGFYLRTQVKIGGRAIYRTRPLFRDWKLTLDVSYFPAVVSKAQIDVAIEKAGMFVGLSDFRPDYGRFSVEEVRKKK